MTKRNTSEKLKTRAKELRTDQTYAESLLWDKLRSKKLNGLKFYRQYPVGGYIADFYCRELKLIVELDGEIHMHQENMRHDDIRDANLLSEGYCILRFTNSKIINDMAGVIQSIVNWQINYDNAQ
jgi:very-short-patch-repair endonuclease